MDPVRRRLLTAGTAVTVSLGLGAFARALATTPGAATQPGPYGALGTPDRYGVKLPAGFNARLLARTGDIVPGTGYTWHGAPDGGATFASPDGAGWVYVSNCELDGGRGGASAIRFDANGQVNDAYRILDGTKWNCAGGATPWGTWLSCEEFPGGEVWECAPHHSGQGVARPALGRFKHEAAAVDPTTSRVYLTEDDYDGRLYRFTPRRWGDLRSGKLEAAAVKDGRVAWRRVSADRPYRGGDTSPFQRGEGAWFAAGIVYFSTTEDNRVWALDVEANTLTVIYDAATHGADAPLHNPDNVTVHAPSGDIFVAEDGADLQLVLLADKQGRRIAEPFLQLVGHDRSELAGPAFCPQGHRLYVTSQRGMDQSLGMTFEIVGPFRRV